MRSAHAPNAQVAEGGGVKAAQVMRSDEERPFDTKHVACSARRSSVAPVVRCANRFVAELARVPISITSDRNSGEFRYKL